MFLSFCYLLNLLRLSWLVAALRWCILRLFIERREFGSYARPERVGYNGWVSVRPFGPIAFYRLDGSRQLRW